METSILHVAAARDGPHHPKSILSLRERKTACLQVPVSLPPLWVEMSPAFVCVWLHPQQLPESLFKSIAWTKAKQSLCSLAPKMHEISELKGPIESPFSRQDVTFGKVAQRSDSLLQPLPSHGFSKALHQALFSTLSGFEYVILCQVAWGVHHIENIM